MGDAGGVALGSRACRRGASRGRWERRRVARRAAGGAARALRGGVPAMSRAGTSPRRSCRPHCPPSAPHGAGRARTGANAHRRLVPPHHAQERGDTRAITAATDAVISPLAGAPPARAHIPSEPGPRAHHTAMISVSGVNAPLPRGFRRLAPRRSARTDHPHTHQPVVCTLPSSLSVLTADAHAPPLPCLSITA